MARFYPKSGFFLLVLMVMGLLAACGAQGDYERRVVQYSTSSGFESVTNGPSASESPPVESPNDGSETEEPETPPAEDGPEETPSEESEETPPEEEGPAEAPLPAGADPFADRVVSYRLGEGGGLNEEDLPGVVLGGPRGFGLFQGSFHVLSLGVGGEIVLEMTDYWIFDGDGPDFLVFENAFQVSGSSATFAEPGVVGVSEDGVDFLEFPCDLSAAPYEGCAGVQPVLANIDTNAIDPTDPSVSGGDGFDLRVVGLRTARFIRIRDSGLGLGPIGSGTRGFDLDAVAVIHGTLP